MEEIDNEANRKLCKQFYEFMWDQFADWYIEISKTRLYEEAGGNNPEEATVAEKVVVYDKGSDGANVAMNEDTIQLVIQDGVEAFLPLSGLIDPENEWKRLTKQQEKLQVQIQKRLLLLLKKPKVNWPKWKHKLVWSKRAAMLDRSKISSYANHV